MKKTHKILLLILLVGLIAASCNKNYYSGTRKGSDCGCPSHKGMVGY